MTILAIVHRPSTRNWFVVFVALAAFACGSSSRTGSQDGGGGSGAVTSGAGGDAGSGATGGSGQAGSTNSGSGGTGATGGTAASTGGVGGSNAGAGGANAGSTGDAGMGNDGGRAGTPAGGGQGGAGVGGQGGEGAGGSAGTAGMAGAAGAGGSPPSGLDDGEVNVDLTITAMDSSARVTSCPGEYPYDPGVMADLAGVRTGTIKCERTTTEGTLTFHSLYLGLNPERVGVHDARDLTITCTTNPPLCESIATLTVTYRSPDGGNTVQISASQADARSGTFRLDQFTADGEVSGSLDLTLTEGEDTVHIEGRFSGNLRNCGTVMSLSYDVCTGDPA